tara:strand:+ start:143 stop:421 length:279 start_codon:yes stop_codon:yes gene_type:complete
LSDYFLKKGIYLDNNSNTIITITRVDLSQDLRHAKVFLTSMTDSSKKEEIIKLLNQNANQYKYIVGKKIRTKNIPKIRFFYDEMFGVELRVD